MLTSPEQCSLIVSQSILIRAFYVFLTKSSREDPQEYENRRKIAVRYISFTHACITALGSFVCVILEPGLLLGKKQENMHEDTLWIAQHSIMISISYFIYDFADMIAHGEMDKYKEYLMHHTCVLAAQSLALFDLCQTGNLFTAVIGLLPELNTVFIHMRLILKMNGTDRKSALYVWNQWLNIISFVPVRFVPMGALFLMVTVFSPTFGYTWTETVVYAIGSGFGSVHNYRIFTRLLIAEGYFQAPAHKRLERMESD